MGVLSSLSSITLLLSISSSLKQFTMGWTAPPAAPKCPACSISVYPAESFMAFDRTPFHKQCVKCKQCGKGLNSSTLNEHDKQLYCKPCYEMVFVNAKHHSGSYDGIVTPEDLLRKEEEEKKRLAKPERQKHER